jgi:hypothetical protein
VKQFTLKPGGQGYIHSDALDRARALGGGKMKQTNLMRWIEAAEARSVWMLAEENTAKPAVVAALPEAQPAHSVLARLREQFCLGEATRRVAPFFRSAV